MEQRDDGASSNNTTEAEMVYFWFVLPQMPASEYSYHSTALTALTFPGLMRMLRSGTTTYFP